MTPNNPDSQEKTLMGAPRAVKRETLANKVDHHDMDVVHCRYPPRGVVGLKDSLDATSNSEAPTNGTIPRLGSTPAMSDILPIMVAHISRVFRSTMDQSVEALAECQGLTNMRDSRRAKE